MASLYRKWRPKKFSEVSGQPHVVDTITNALRQKIAGHAYLFTGPRGTGKTSVARLLAKSLNCLTPSENGGSCNECTICNSVDDGSFLDIIEIDAASNRGIDEMRELRDKVRFKPTLGRKKVYIIDEVHMLTKEAFNALLKTLEEPPDHVVFILATTEPHKVPQTIISRTQRFDFRPATEEDLINQLKKVSTEEKIKITDDANSFIASVADGSFRDALSLLEQIQSVAGDKVINQKQLEDLLGLPSQQIVGNLFEAWCEGSVEKIHQVLHLAQEGGINIEQLNKQLLKYINKTLIARSKSLPSTANNSSLSTLATKVEIKDMMKLMTQLIEQSYNIKHSPVAQIPLELALLGTIAEPPEIKSSVPEESQSIQNEQFVKEVKTVIPTIVESETDIQSQSQVEVYEIADEEEFRKALLDAAKPLNHSIFATLKVANILRDGKKCIIEVHYPFHQEQLTKRSAKALLQDLVKKFSCTDLEIKLNREVKNTKSNKTQDDELLKIANEVFQE